MGAKCDRISRSIQYKYVGRPSVSQDGLAIYTLLNLQEDVRLPVVQFRDLIELEYRPSKGLDITALDRFHKEIHEFGLTGCREGGVQGPVLRKVALGGHRILEISSE